MRAVSFKLFPFACLIAIINMVVIFLLSLYVEDDDVTQEASRAHEKGGRDMLVDTKTVHIKTEEGHSTESHGESVTRSESERDKKKKDKKDKKKKDKKKSKATEHVAIAAPTHVGNGSATSSRLELYKSMISSSS